MNNKKQLNEKFSKSEEKRIKSIIRSEVDKLKKKELKSLIKQEIESHIKKMDIKDLDKDFDKTVEDIFKNMMQKYHEMFYRKKHIMKSYLK
tara:strand:- start:116 stop:388 length:273 start_codon:yes stop_codon:yes gene_type:complete